MALHFLRFRVVWRFFPLLTVLLVWTTILLLFDLDPRDILRFLLYCLWGVILPGVLVYRAIRANHHSFIDDMVIGAVVGLVLEIGAYCLFAAFSLHRWLILWPLAIAIPFVLIRPLRRHWWVTGGRRAPLGWSWAIAGVIVFFTMYIAGVELATQAPAITSTGSWYMFDMQGLLALAAEAKHHFPLQAPMVAGESLSYHWFACAHEATASLISGVELSVVYHGFQPLVMGGISVMSLAVVGWRLSGRPWVGAVAGLLTFVVGELTVGSSSDWLGSSTTFVWISTTTVFSWPLLYTLALVTADRIAKNGLPDAPIGRGSWFLIAIFALASTGAKSTGLPSLVCGVLLAAFVCLIRDRRLRALLPYGGALLIMVSAFVFAYFALYHGGGSSGLILRPLSTLDIPTITRSDSSQKYRLFVHVVALGGYLIYELPRLAGIPVLGWLAYKRKASWGPIEWLLLGGIVGGLMATLLTGHPSGSQLYFIRSIWGIGAILSAIGFVRFVESKAIAPSALAVVGVGSALAVIIPYCLVYRRVRTIHYWPNIKLMIPMYVGAALIVGVLILGAVCWPWIRGRWAAARNLGTVTALTVVLLAGLPNFPTDARITSAWNRTGSFHEFITPDMVRAGQWLRTHSDPDDIVATNQHVAVVSNGIALATWINGYAERRTLVGGWIYFTRSIQIAEEKGMDFKTIPFWDTELIKRNDAVFSSPNRELISWMKNTHGVRWLVVNRDITGRESSDLANFAEVRFQRGAIVIYQIR